MRYGKLFSFFFFFPIFPLLPSLSFLSFLSLLSFFLHSLQEACIPDFLQEEPAVQQGHGLVALPPVVLFTEVLHHIRGASTLKRRTCRQVHTCNGSCCPRGACTNIELSIYFSCDNTSLYTQYLLALLYLDCDVIYISQIWKA